MAEKILLAGWILDVQQGNTASGGGLGYVTCELYYTYPNTLEITSTWSGSAYGFQGVPTYENHETRVLSGILVNNKAYVITAHKNYESLNPLYSPLSYQTYQSWHATANTQTYTITDGISSGTNTVTFFTTWEGLVSKGAVWDFPQRALGVSITDSTSSITGYNETNFTFVGSQVGKCLPPLRIDTTYSTTKVENGTTIDVELSQTPNWNSGLTSYGNEVQYSYDGSTWSNCSLYVALLPSIRRYYTTVNIDKGGIQFRARNYVIISYTTGVVGGTTTRETFYSDYIYTDEIPIGVLPPGYVFIDGTWNPLKG